ncbi:hypothetical protein WSM22_36730 [Cytophagales bacterium WSM2-2]|nr:hypothetical protein WSM22_36730 [Cytophagales bacterium WSM2-2]
MNTRETKILLVDDDTINQVVARNLLQQCWGAQVTVANNGAEAIMHITRKCFQLVLMDINMPVMDGIEATKRIRAMEDPYFKAVPIFACTASAIADAKELSATAGMNDIITKPIMMDELKLKISKHIPAMRRPLFVNFDLHTDGNADFKDELLPLLISNLEELQEAIVKAGVLSDAKVLRKALHKAKTVTTMLNDPDLNRSAQEINTHCSAGTPVASFQRELDYLYNICGQVRESLIMEINQHNQVYFNTYSTSPGFRISAAQ